MNDTIKNTQIIHWLSLSCKAFEENKQLLSDLDSAIGDADHGANMIRGFQAVVAKEAEMQGKDIGAIFKLVAMTLMSTVGGSSGPLYGTFFLQAAAVAAGKNEITLAELSQGFSAGLAGLMTRGKTEVGDKTMVDALFPAFEALKPVSAEDTLHAGLERMVTAAQKGAESTKDIIAKKGRASYLGERSSGQMDPGCASSVMLLKALQDAAKA